MAFDLDDNGCLELAFMPLIVSHLLVQSNYQVAHTYILTSSKPIAKSWDLIDSMFVSNDLYM